MCMSETVQEGVVLVCFEACIQKILLKSILLKSSVAYALFTLLVVCMAILMHTMCRQFYFLMIVLMLRIYWVQYIPKLWEKQGIFLAPQEEALQKRQSKVLR